MIKKLKDILSGIGLVIAAFAMIFLGVAVIFLIKKIFNP
jgi:uncharacterized membrane protein